MMQLPKCAERNRPQGVIFRNRRSVTVGSAAGGKMAQNMAPVRGRQNGLQGSMFSAFSHKKEETSWHFRYCRIIYNQNSRCPINS